MTTAVLAHLPGKHNQLNHGREGGARFEVFGGVDAVSGEVFQFGGGNVELVVDGDGLKLGYRNGGDTNTSGSLDRRATTTLFYLLDHSDPDEEYDYPFTDSAATYPSGDGQATATGFAQVTWLNKDTARLELLDNDATVDLTRTEAKQLSDAVYLHSTDRRFDTMYGRLDMYLTGKRFGFRMPTESGEMTEVEFDAKSWAGIATALNLVHEGFDEDAIPADAPDDYEPPEFSVRHVQTNVGKVRVERFGTVDAPDSFLITPAQYKEGDWAIALPGRGNASFAPLEFTDQDPHQHLGELATTAEAIGWYDQYPTKPAKITAAALDGAQPAIGQVGNVELIHAGTWALSTGETTFTVDDLYSAVAALDCPAVRRPILKLGHTDDPAPGQPAIGFIGNLAVAENGRTLVGDYVGMPGWLCVADEATGQSVLSSAYPDRSVEGFFDFRCQLGHTHPFVLTAVALLGQEMPGVGTIQSLQDLAGLYGVAAAGAPAGEPWRVHASQPVAAHLPGRHNQMDHAGKGKWAAKLDAALPHAKGDGDSAYFGGDDDENPRYLDWSTNSDGVRAVEIGNEDGETVAFEATNEDLRQLVSAMSITMLQNEAPPPDPTDKQSQLIASLMLAGSHGAVYFGDTEDTDDSARYFDWSAQRGAEGQYVLEAGANGDSVQVELTPDEFAQLHAELVRTLTAPS